MIHSFRFIAIVGHEPIHKQVGVKDGDIYERDNQSVI